MQEKAREEVISVLGNYPNTIPNSDQLKVLIHYNHSVLIFFILKNIVFLGIEIR
jgi:hypothetical protein